MLLFALLVLIWLPSWLFVRRSFFCFFSVVCSFRFQFSILCLSFFFCCFNFDLSTCHRHTFIFFQLHFHFISLFFPSPFISQTWIAPRWNSFSRYRSSLPDHQTLSFSSHVPLSLLSCSFSSHDRSQHSVRISKHVLSPAFSSFIHYILSLPRAERFITTPSSTSVT